MARKLTKEEQASAKADFDAPSDLATLQNSQNKKNSQNKPAAKAPKAAPRKGGEYVPPVPPKIELPKVETELFPPPPRSQAPAPAAPAAPAPKKRGHKSPWPEGTELQRVNVFLPVETARMVRAAAVARGVDLGFLLDDIIREHIKIGFLIR